MNVGTTFFCFVTNYAFDRQTDGQTDGFLVASPRWHSMQRGKNWFKQQPSLFSHFSPAD